METIGVGLFPRKMIWNSCILLKVSFYLFIYNLLGKLEGLKF